MGIDDLPGIDDDIPGIEEEVPGIDDVDDINAPKPAAVEAGPQSKVKYPSDDIPNLDEFENENLGLEEDEDAIDDFEEFQTNDVVRTRTYDVSIAYDKYYQVPHV